MMAESVRMCLWKYVTRGHVVVPICERVCACRGYIEEAVKIVIDI